MNWSRIGRAAGASLFLGALALAAQECFELWRVAPPVGPRSSADWIEQGLAAEDSGDYSVAERALLEAARVDRQYLPAWTLANFYFRREDPERFWPWARRAAQLSYAELPPLLRLCDELEPDPGRVLEHVTGTPRIHRAFLDYLLARQRLEAAQVVALRMQGEPDSAARLAELARLRAAAKAHTAP